MNFIRTHLTARKHNHKQYASFIRSREIAANQSALVQTVVNTATPALPVENHPDRNLNSDVREAMRQSLGESHTITADANIPRNNSARLRADSVNGSPVSSTSDSDNDKANTLETRRAIRNLLDSDSDESNTNIENILDNEDFKGIVGAVPPATNTESNSTPMISNVSGDLNIASTLPVTNTNAVVGEIVN